MALSRGSLYKRGKVWWVKWARSRGCAPERRSTGCRDKRAAEIVAERLIRRQELEDAGVHVPDEDVSLDALVTAWEKWRLAPPQECTPEHVRQSAANVRGFLASGVTRLEDLTRQRAERWLADARAEQGISDRTYNKRRADLRAWGRYLLEEAHAILWHPFSGLKPVRERTQPRKPRGHDEAEVTRLLAAAPWRRRIVYETVLATGLRRAEIGRLEVRDLGLDRGVAVVRGESSKMRREELVPLPAHICKMLGQVLELRRQGITEEPAMVERIRALRRDGWSVEAISHELRTTGAKRADGTHWWWHRVREVLEPTPQELDPHERVFAGEPMKALQHTLHRDLEQAGIALVTPDGRSGYRALRKTFATRLRRAGVHPIVIQKLLRHSTLRLTTTTYQQHDIDELRAAVTLLSAS